MKFPLLLLVAASFSFAQWGGGGGKSLNDYKKESVSGRDIHVYAPSNAKVVAAKHGAAWLAARRAVVPCGHDVGDVFGIEGYPKHVALACRIDNNDGWRERNDGLEVLGPKCRNEHGEQATLAVTA